MSSLLGTPRIGQSLSDLDTPQVLIDLDGVDSNLRGMFAGGKKYGVNVRVHFKSLKCSGLARYIQTVGGSACGGFLCAKLNEAEVLADAGLTDILIANEIVGTIKLHRLALLAKRSTLRVCVDNFDNVNAIAAAMDAVGASIGVLIELDIGMKRCGVEPGEMVLPLARHIQKFPSLKFLGLQGYDGHLQQIADPAERERRCREGMALFIDARRQLEDGGIPVEVMTGGGTGTWEFVASTPGITEIQPGSFVLMDSMYNTIRPEFACTLSIMANVMSKHPDYYVLDAGSKAISYEFGMPTILGRPQDKVVRLAEEHTKVECTDASLKVGDRVRVIPAHCCATMNLHRVCIGVRDDAVEAVWPIEASGRYD